MKHLVKNLESGTQCTICLKTWKTKPRKENCLGLPEQLAIPNHLVTKDYFRKYNEKPSNRAVACYVNNWYSPPNPYFGKAGTSARRGYREYYLRNLLYDRRDAKIDDPKFPPILDWKNRPKDLYTEYKLERWNLKPGEAKAKAAIWHWTNEEWVFFYDQADCEIDDTSLPPCYDQQGIPEELNTKTDWEKARPNEVIPAETKPKGCYRYYSPKRYEWFTVYLYLESDLIWHPKDNLISKSILKSKYLLSDGWIKRLGECDRETIHSTYKTPIYLYSRKRVEKFIADNAGEYAEWLTKRDRYIAIFNNNKDKILAALSKGVEKRKAKTKEKKQLRKAQTIANKFNWDKDKNIVQQQMVRCLTCNYSSIYSGDLRKDFICTVHPYGIELDQMPCSDFLPKKDE